jgi:hypothetical protein
MAVRVVALVEQTALEVETLAELQHQGKVMQVVIRNLLMAGQLHQAVRVVEQAVRELCRLSFLTLKLKMALLAVRQVQTIQLGQQQLQQV